MERLNLHHHANSLHIIRLECNTPETYQRELKASLSLDPSTHCPIPQSNALPGGTPFTWFEVIQHAPFSITRSLGFLRSQAIFFFPFSWLIYSYKWVTLSTVLKIFIEWRKTGWFCHPYQVNKNWLQDWSLGGREELPSSSKWAGTLKKYGYLIPIGVI